MVNRSTKSFGLILCLLLVMMISLSGCGKETEAAKENALSVSLTEAKVMDLVQNSSYSGIVRGSNEVTVMPKVSARVAAIYLKPGDPVSAGQTIMTLDDSDYTAAIRSAQAGVAQAEAAVRTNAVQLESARVNYERSQQLFAAGALSQASLDSAKTAFDALNSGTAEAAAASARAALAAAQDAASKCTITSPINGVVGSVNLQLGETASPAVAAAIVTDSADLEVEVMVNENEVSYIKEGSEVNVAIKAAGLNQIKGRVESIATVADPAKRNFTAKVALPNQDGKIRSGMFAELTMNTVSKADVLCLPVNAVVSKNGASIVYTVDKDNKARSVQVETGIKNNSYVEITKGLKAGQQVIAKGNTLISDGSLVRVIGGGSK